MRLVIEVDGTRDEVELAQAVETATLADLVEHACDLRLSAEETLWVDGHRHDAGDLVHDLNLLEGSRIARSPLERPEPMKGWAASVSGGLDVGYTVSVPTHRPLLIGRSPARRPHGGLPRARPGIRRASNTRTTGCGSATPGRPTAPSSTASGSATRGSCSTTTGSSWSAGATITLWRGSQEELAPAPGSLRNLTRAATVPFNRPPRPGLPPRPGRTGTADPQTSAARRPNSAWPRSGRRC